MHAASATKMSYEAYLELENKGGDVKHEWCDGVVYAMSRGTPEHARLTMRIGAALLAAFKGECEVFSSDAMIYVEQARLSTYADATVVYGTLGTKSEAITNPTVIIEVLSEATERYDRDGKFKAYQQLASLREYVLVSQDTRRIEVYRRDGDEWSVEVGEAGGRVAIHGAAIVVDDVYV
jgi:Uma2 family endonuclease